MDRRLCDEMFCHRVSYILSFTKARFHKAAEFNIASLPDAFPTSPNSMVDTFHYTDFVSEHLTTFGGLSW